MDNYNKLLEILEELEVFERDELRTLYEHKQKLQEQENKLMMFEQKLFSLKKDIHENVFDSDISEAYSRLEVLKDLIKTLSEDKASIIQNMIKPINLQFVDDLELDPYEDKQTKK